MFNNTIPREPSARFTNLAILSCMFNNVITSNIRIEGSGRCNPHVSSEKGGETDRGDSCVLNNTTTIVPSTRFTTLTILFRMFNIIISNIGIEGSGRCNPHVSSEKGSETGRGFFYVFNYIIQENPQFVSRPLRSSL